MSRSPSIWVIPTEDDDSGHGSSSTGLTSVSPYGEHLVNSMDGVVFDTSPFPSSSAPRTLKLTSRVLLPFCHLLLADFQEVIPPPAPTPPLVRLRNIPGPTSSSTPSRRARNTYAPDSGPPLRNPGCISISGTSGLSSDLGL
ncbi:uncharacterized protein EI90DRAFT_3123281 [Cantharellus anzutake]|uniref:uncharacterized protein n=1 Tax=Cantharellus anzutake TaxID=1750568 RepID=UPI001908A6D1|nr:uncharacterized protein EI90DRAFT_3123281 [Cantharellus anzutake]KAF8331695.1 hypothetical protein EI90DRAFT_3123281 [Cantharellus anzutake]